MKTVVLLAAFALVLSCGDSSTGPNPPPEDDWIPLTAGNLWNGVIEGFIVPGADADTVEVGGSIERRITALKDHAGGFQVYEMRTVTETVLTHPDTMITMTDTAFAYLRNTGDEMRDYEDTVSTYYELNAPFPLTLSETWEPWEDSSYVCEVVSLGATITVPAGTFSDCAIIRRTDTEDSLVQWDTYLHRGTGIVRDRIVHSDTLDVSIDLESYSVQ